MASGAGTLARPALLAEYYGAANYGSINGVLAFFLASAQALAPVGTGALYSFFGRYEPMLWIVALILSVAIGTVLRIEPSAAPVASLS